MARHRATRWRRLEPLDDTTAVETEVEVQGNLRGKVVVDVSVIHRLLEEAGYQRDDDGA